MDRLEELKVVELGEKIGYKKGFEDARKQFERPHGEWIDCEDNNYCKCSICGNIVMIEEVTTYCGSCGASMAKEG